MKRIIKRINVGVVFVFAVSVISGLIFMAFGNEDFSTKILIGAAVILPILLATKGIEFMVENQFWKASLSILMLLAVCMLSILFVFA